MKVALLIGVSEYGDGISPLSAAPNDVKAMQRVLADPNMGGFDEVNPLINPNETEMKTAILRLFANRDKEDLILLFFSGHGITDDDEHLYLTTRGTTKDYFRATAVPASFVHKESSYSRAKRQVIILDCCYSGAFVAGWQAKSVGVDIKRELGGEGRVVLTSSTATQISFQQEDSMLSLYTHYLVEGIETGEADTDNNGEIYVRELHDYAKKKVHNVKPNMKPDIILDREGFNILLAKARKNTEAEYRQLVARYASNGEISKAGRLILQKKQQDLGIAGEVATEIESEFLEPFRRQRLKNLELYREAFIEAVEYRYPLLQTSGDELKDLQEIYGLKNEEVEGIEKEIVAEKERKCQRQQEAKKQPGQKEDKDSFSELDFDNFGNLDFASFGEPFEETPSIRLIAEIDNLSSEKGVDYSKLCDLLKAGKWKEADEETQTVILKASGRENKGWLDRESIENFPSSDLRTIDNLWIKYSNGRFGFSVQKHIWKSFGGTPGVEDYDIYCKFVLSVGWRKQKNKWLGLKREEEQLEYSKINFSKNAPPGHLPNMGTSEVGGCVLVWLGWISLLSRQDL